MENKDNLISNEEKRRIARKAQEVLGFNGYESLTKPVEQDKSVMDPCEEQSLASVLEKLNINFVPPNIAEYYFAAITAHKLGLQNMTPAKFQRYKTVSNNDDLLAILFIVVPLIGLGLWMLQFEGPVTYDIIFFVCMISCLIGFIYLQKKLDTIINKIESSCFMEACNVKGLALSSINVNLIRYALQIKESDGSAEFQVHFFKDTDNNPDENLQALRVTNNSGEEWFIMNPSYKNVFH